MTAETLKPFIAPQNVESFPTVHPSAATKHQYHRRINLLAIGISIITLAFMALFAGYTIWLSMRINSTETELSRLNRVIESLQNRLGIHYLDEIQDFEKEYALANIDKPTSLDDIENDYDDDDNDDNSDDVDNDDDDDEDYYSNYQKLGKPSKEDDVSQDINYDEQIAEYLKKFNQDDDDEDGDDDDDSDVVTGDSLYNDFEKYKDSKSKDENSSRVTRSIENPPHEAKHEGRVNKTNTIQNDDVEIVDLQASTKRPHQQQRRLSASTENVGHTRHAGFVREEHMESRQRSPLRQKSHRRHKFAIKKSGDSLISAKYSTPARSISYDAASSTGANKPAAHFHLHQKISHHHANTKEDGYHGDVYIAHHPSWSNEVDSEHYFSVNQGYLTVREPGLYYVYAQICYNNTYDVNGFLIFHNHEPLLQCISTVPMNQPKFHTCHTSGLVYLRGNDPIHIRDFHSDRSVVLRNSNNRSYFGLMKV